MSNNVIADFVAQFTIDTQVNPEPTKGRIVLSKKGLVLAGNESRESIPLNAIFDISVGYTPPDMEDFFQDTMTIAYAKGKERHVAVIETGGDEVKRFKTLLFKAQLTGTKASVKHPARVGGRVTEAQYQPAKLRIGRGKVEFRSKANPFTVDLSTVTHFEKQRRTVNGTSRPVLTVRHVSDGQTVLSEFAVGSERKLNLFGRYLRLEYSEIVAETEKIDVTEEEMETLVAIYSGGSSTSLANILGADSSYVTMILNSLREKKLVVESDDTLSLTTEGRMMVSDRLESVNT